MFRSWSRAVLIIALFLSPAAPVFAGGYNLAQYPLRVHIFQRTEQAHSSRQTVERRTGLRLRISLRRKADDVFGI